MKQRDIARYRLVRQHIAASKLSSPAEVVSSLGAVQAQDYLGALWAIGLRLPGGTESMVEEAVADRTIVRTWPMRGTLHFVAASDVHWMLELLAPRAIRAAEGRMRRLGIDEAAMLRSRELLAGALQGGKRLTRPEAYAVLEKGGVRTAGQRGLQITWRLAHEGLLCLAGREGKLHTFALLDEWVPRGRRFGREEALAELARRYFAGHGPASVRDFAWWSGLRISEAEEGLLAVSAGLSRHDVGDAVYWASPEPQELMGASGGFLLPAFDEFAVGYTDRRAALSEDRAGERPSGFVVLGPAAIADGRMVGNWRRTLDKTGCSVALAPFARLSAAERRALSAHAERYGRFLGASVEVH